MLLLRKRSIIELIGKAGVFIGEKTNSEPVLLQKARLARVVVSNPKLSDLNLRFYYEKPFDNLLKIGLNTNWWAMTGSNRRHLPCKGSALPAELIAHTLLSVIVAFKNLFVN